MLIFFPSADPASRARLKVKNNSTVRVGRRSAVGEMLLEEVHKETYLLGAYGYQDVFNSLSFFPIKTIIIYRIMNNCSNTDLIIS